MPIETLLSIIVVQSSLDIIEKLLQQKQIGDKIMMLTYMVRELLLFLILLSGFFILFLMLGITLKQELKDSELPIYIDLLNSIKGNIPFG